MTSLLTLIIAIAALLGPRDRGPADEVEATLVGIARAVDADDLPPLTGSKEGDAALMTTFAFHESRFRLWDPKRPGRCISGDGGRSYGPLQIQGLAEEIACAPAEAAARWLEIARASIGRCGDLTALVSGHCGGAPKLARWRVREAATLRRRIGR